MTTLRVMWAGLLTLITLLWVEGVVEVLMWIGREHPDGMLSILVATTLIGLSVGAFLIASAMLAVLGALVALMQPLSIEVSHEAHNHSND